MDGLQIHNILQSLNGLETREQIVVLVKQAFSTKSLNPRNLKIWVELLELLCKEKVEKFGPCLVALVRYLMQKLGESSKRLPNSGYRVEQAMSNMITGFVNAKRMVEVRELLDWTFLRLEQHFPEHALLHLEISKPSSRRSYTMHMDRNMPRDLVLILVSCQMSCLYCMDHCLEDVESFIQVSTCLAANLQQAFSLHSSYIQNCIDAAFKLLYRYFQTDVVDPVQSSRLKCLATQIYGQSSGFSLKTYIDLLCLVAKSMSLLSKTDLKLVYPSYAIFVEQHVLPMFGKTDPRVLCENWKWIHAIDKLVSTFIRIRDDRLEGISQKCLLIMSNTIESPVLAGRLAIYTLILDFYCGKRLGLDLDHFESEMSPLEANYSRWFDSRSMAFLMDFGNKARKMDLHRDVVMFVQKILDFLIHSQGASIWDFLINALAPIRHSRYIEITEFFLDKFLEYIPTIPLGEMCSAATNLNRQFMSVYESPLWCARLASICEAVLARANNSVIRGFWSLWLFRNDNLPLCKQQLDMVARQDLADYPLCSKLLGLALFNGWSHEFVELLKHCLSSHAIQQPETDSFQLCVLGFYLFGIESWDYFSWLQTVQSNLAVSKILKFHHSLALESHEHLPRRTLAAMATYYFLVGDIDNGVKCHAMIQAESIDESGQAVEIVEFCYFQAISKYRINGGVVESLAQCLHGLARLERLKDSLRFTDSIVQIPIVPEWYLSTLYWLVFDWTAQMYLQMGSYNETKYYVTQGLQTSLGRFNAMFRARLLEFECVAETQSASSLKINMDALEPLSCALILRLGLCNALNTHSISEDRIHQLHPAMKKYLENLDIHHLSDLEFFRVFQLSPNRAATYLWNRLKQMVGQSNDAIIGKLLLYSDMLHASATPFLLTNLYDLGLGVLAQNCLENAETAICLLDSRIGVLFRREKCLYLELQKHRSRQTIYKWYRESPKTLLSQGCYRSPIPEHTICIILGLVFLDQEYLYIARKDFRDSHCIRIPMGKSGQLCTIQAEFSSVMQENNDSTSVQEFYRLSNTAEGVGRAEWWARRLDLDKKLERLVRRVEDEWFGIFKYMLLPRQIDDTWERFRDQIDALLGIKCPEMVLHCLFKYCQNKKSDSPNTMYLDQWLDWISARIPGQCLESLKTSVMDLLDTIDVGHENPFDDNHLFLMVDDHLHFFPFESMSVLWNRSISRVPCMASLFELLAWKSTRIGLDRGVLCVLNPGGDLNHTQNLFEPLFQQARPDRLCSSKWCLISFQTEGPIALSNLSHNLHNFGIYLYFGHGTGEQYVRFSTIRRTLLNSDFGEFRVPISFLMGCSSGKLVKHGRFDAFGAPFDHLLFSSLALVANAWDVTDRDIDRFSKMCLAKWGLFREMQTRGSLSACASIARRACYLRYLVGAAPIVYGLPVRLDRQKC